MGHGAEAGVRRRHGQRRPAEPAERAAVLHARRHRHGEQRHDHAVQSQHQADEAFAQAAVGAEERRDEGDEAHAERKHERHGGEPEQRAVAEHRRNFCIETVFTG
jgi:hypothetical protein